MRSNFNDLFNERLTEFLDAPGIEIEDVVDEMLKDFRFSEHVTKSRLVRWFVRSRLTTALNNNQIYSYEKGKFVYIENASESQLAHFMDKARRDIAAAEARRSNAEDLLNQISLAWDENGNFIGYHIPQAVNE